MSMLGLAGRLTLATVFAVAAIGKLRHLGAAREMLRSLGLPSTSLAAIGLSLGELLLCAGLLTSRWAHPAALVATLTLTGFTVALVVARLRGRTPVCACFGAAEPMPVTARTLIRNLALVAVGGGRDRHRRHAGAGSLGARRAGRRSRVSRGGRRHRLPGAALWPSTVARSGARGQVVGT